ncbi:hypothetical protein B484DRAFT_461589, partial [Ochromonadaceae sp. CCMP2298]
MIRGVKATRVSQVRRIRHVPKERQRIKQPTVNHIYYKMQYLATNEVKLMSLREARSRGQGVWNVGWSAGYWVVGFDNRGLTILRGRLCTPLNRVDLPTRRGPGTLDGFFTSLSPASGQSIAMQNLAAAHGDTAREETAERAETEEEAEYATDVRQRVLDLRRVAAEQGEGQAAGSLHESSASSSSSSTSEASVVYVTTNTPTHAAGAMTEQQMEVDTQEDGQEEEMKVNDNREEMQVYQGVADSVRQAIQDGARSDLRDAYSTGPVPDAAAATVSRYRNENAERLHDIRNGGTHRSDTLPVEDIPVKELDGAVTEQQRRMTEHRQHLKRLRDLYERGKEHFTKTLSEALE